MVLSASCVRTNFTSGTCFGAGGRPATLHSHLMAVSSFTFLLYPEAALSHSKEAMAKGRTPLRKSVGSASKRSARKEPVYESDDSLPDPNGNMHFASGGGDDSSEEDEEVFNLGADNDESDDDSMEEDDDSEVSRVFEGPAEAALRTVGSKP